MFRLFAAALVTSLAAVSAAHAGDRAKLGYGRLITNDYIGDGEDRWRTGSLTSSRVWGPEWTGRAPARFGDLIELRLGAEILAPENLGSPDAGDRPYAGTLSVGVHTHYRWKGFDMAVGADMVITGADTGLGSLQRELHDLLGVDAPSDATLDAQIGDGFHPTLVAEMARVVPISGDMTLRPFLEGRAGAETLLRAGIDLTVGRIGQGELLIRENATGQRYRVIQNAQYEGFTFVIGADLAQVVDSIYLPQDRGYDLRNSRERVRAGLHWQGSSASAFYGLTYLGREFEAQEEGQLVGSVRINFNF